MINHIFAKLQLFNFIANSQQRQWQCCHKIAEQINWTSTSSTRLNVEAKHSANRQNMLITITNNIMLKLCWSMHYQVNNAFGIWHQIKTENKFVSTCHWRRVLQFYLVTHCLTQMLGNTKTRIEPKTGKSVMNYLESIINYQLQSSSMKAVSLQLHGSHGSGSQCWSQWVRE